MLEVVDVSNNNPHPIDWAAVKAAGISAVIVKVTQANNYVNPDAASDIAAARAAGLFTAAYHFVDMEVPVASQLAWLKAHLYGCKLVVIDSEWSLQDNYDWQMTPAQWGEVATITHDMLTGAKAFAPEVMLYSSPGFFSNLSGAPWGFLYWLADYSGPPPGAPTMWQYTQTGNVPGISGDVDRSHFYGTEAQLAALFGGTQPQLLEAEMILTTLHDGQTVLFFPESFAFRPLDATPEWLAWVEACPAIPDMRSKPLPENHALKNLGAF